VPLDFANVFQSSVEDGIANTLGRPVMDTLRALISKPFKAYADKPASLHVELARIFGSACATLEKMIAKELFHALNLHYSSELDFDSSVALARHDLMLDQRRNN
jgi:hypothetical protein